jgi:hypothetical protein
MTQNDTRVIPRERYTRLVMARVREQDAEALRRHSDALEVSPSEALRRALRLGLDRLEQQQQGPKP